VAARLRDAHVGTVLAAVSVVFVVVKVLGCALLIWPHLGR